MELSCSVVGVRARHPERRTVGDRVHRMDKVANADRWRTVIVHSQATESGQERLRERARIPCTGPGYLDKVTA